MTAPPEAPPPPPVADAPAAEVTAARAFERAPAGDLEFQRFTRLNRVLHVVMIVSFLSLALTGLTLKFSYTRWAVIVSHLFGGFQYSADNGFYFGIGLGYTASYYLHRSDFTLELRVGKLVVLKMSKAERPERTR